MNIFIDNQYSKIFDGEIKEWVETNILNPLSKHKIFIANNDEEAKNLLMKTPFDIIFISGYTPDLMKYVKMSKDPKVVGLIYDVNAEKLYNKYSKAQLFEAMVSNKSRLIFLCTDILTPSESVADYLRKLYDGYRQVFNLDKIRSLDTIYNITESESKNRRPIKEKYVIFPFSNISFDEPLISPYLKSFIDNTEDIPVKIVVVTKNTNAKVYDKFNGLEDKFILVNENDPNIDSYYKYAVASFFISEYGILTNQIIKSLKNDCITLLNENNDFYKEFGGDDIGYFKMDTELIRVINTLVSLSKKDKEEILEGQHKLLERLENSKPKKTIKKILSI